MSICGFGFFLSKQFFEKEIIETKERAISAESLAFKNICLEKNPLSIYVDQTYLTVLIHIRIYNMITSELSICNVYVNGVVFLPFFKLFNCSGKYIYIYI
jgi:hypothetical protein